METFGVIVGDKLIDQNRYVRTVVALGPRSQLDTAATVFFDTGEARPLLEVVATMSKVVPLAMCRPIPDNA